jgi:hypothetical protein
LHSTEASVAAYFAQRRHSTRRREGGETMGVRRDIVGVVGGVVVVVVGSCS